MSPELLLSASAVLGIAGLGVLVATHPTSTERRALGFPPELEDRQVVALLGAIAGLPARARVRLRAVGQDGRLSFAIVAAPGDLQSLRAIARGALPGLRFLTPDAEPEEPATLRAFIGWRGSHVLLRDDEPGLATAALLGALQGAGHDERVQLSVRLRPIVRPKAPRQRPRRDRDVWSRLTAPVAEIPTDELRLVRATYGAPLLSVAIEVEIWAASRSRARALLRQVVAVLRSRSGRRGRFSVRSRRWSLPSVGTALTPKQVAPLLAWPLDSPVIPGVDLVREPALLPDRRIPARGGRSFGTSTWPGMEQRKLNQPIEGGLSHALVLGPTGSGKSALLTNLILDDVADKRGALLLDMKGDTAEELLERLPAARHNDVVILDPADDRPLPGLKSLGAATPDLAADLWVGIFRNLFADSWGIRTERYLRLGLQTLAYDPTATITELPRVFTDQALRRRLLSRTNDPLLQSAWASFESLSQAQQAEHLAAPLGKVQDVLGRRLLRAVLGQAEPRMTVARAMRERKIFVVRLVPGLIGPPTSQVLGALVMYELYQAVMARQAIPKERRVPFAVYVDEPAVLQALPVPLDSLFELARGLGVGLTIGTQTVEQLPDRVRKAALTNAATVVTFRPNAEDAPLMARQLPPLSVDQIKNLKRFTVAMRMGLAHGEISDTVTVATPAPKLPLTHPTRLRNIAAHRYGVAAEATEAALRERWQMASEAAGPEPRPSAPIGRRRRQP